MERSQLTLTVLDRYLEPALELLADLVLRPSFPEEELEKVRSRWRSHLLSQRSQPVFLARERSHAALYGSHPYSRVSFPVSHLEAADREALRGVHRRLLAPQGALLAFSGAVKAGPRHTPDRTLPGRLEGEGAATRSLPAAAGPPIPGRCCWSTGPIPSRPGSWWPAAGCPGVIGIRPVCFWPTRFWGGAPAHGSF